MRWIIIIIINYRSQVKRVSHDTIGRHTSIRAWIVGRQSWPGRPEKFIFIDNNGKGLRALRAQVHTKTMLERGVHRRILVRN